MSRTPSSSMRHSISARDFDPASESGSRRSSAPNSTPHTPSGMDFHIGSTNHHSGTSGGTGGRNGSPNTLRAGSGGRNSIGNNMGNMGNSRSGSAFDGSEKGKGDSEDAKRRKIQRACDVCRRKKIKCDGPMNSLSTSKCAHCQEYSLDCTYLEAAKRRGPPKGYVETLEQRCGRLERLLSQVYPGINFSEYVGPPLDREDFDLSEYSEQLRSKSIPPYPSLKPFSTPPPITSQPHSNHSSPYAHSPAAGVPSSSNTVLGPSPWKPYERDPKRPVEDNISYDQDDAQVQAEIASAMNRLDVKDGQWRFHGKASLAHLLRTFGELKYKNRVNDSNNAGGGGGGGGGGGTESSENEKEEEILERKDGCGMVNNNHYNRHNSGTVDFLEKVNKVKRPEYWQAPEWELVIANEGVRPIDYSIWPTKGFDKVLIDSYFEKQNFHLPLLNRILFLKQYDSGLYRTNTEFSKVCLMVFANGARFIDDERVYWPRDIAISEEGKERLKNDKDGTIRYSAGWIFLRALMKMGRSIVQGPNLYDFQTQVLICAFFQGSAVPHLTWIMSGLGLRSAQEIGIHVRSTLMLANPIERALYNRAFWCLYHIDRQNCAAIGRSVALQDTDFDADYPIAVDDEYWDTGNPQTDFVQPKEKGVTKVAAFIHTLKLDHVIGGALRTVYAINKPNNEFKGNTEAYIRDQRAIVVELDSALNEWSDNVPDGLRWDPTRSDQSLFLQSAILYVEYYFCQILIHRPFIPTPKNPETIGLPSLAICSNASRSIANIIDAVLRRGRQYAYLPGDSLSIHFMLPAWTAAVVLMVSIYSGKQAEVERERSMKDVKVCINAMKELEIRWRQAGKLTDILMELATDRNDDPPFENLPPLAEKRDSLKRRKDESNEQQEEGRGSGLGEGGSGSGYNSVNMSRNGSTHGGQTFPSSMSDHYSLGKILNQSQERSTASNNRSTPFPSTISNNEPNPISSSSSLARPKVSTPPFLSNGQVDYFTNSGNPPSTESANNNTVSSVDTGTGMWEDTSFLDVWNTDLFGLGDVTMDGINNTAPFGNDLLPTTLTQSAASQNPLASPGLSGSGQNGTVDDLWAQLFAGYSQSMWNPGPGST